MAFLGLKIPPNVASSLRRLEVPGRRENEDQYHVTMFYLGKQVPVEKVTHMVEVAHDVLVKAKPFSLKLNHVTNFPSGKDGFPVICPVESDGLQKLRQKLKEAFDAEGVEYANNFPDYKPHVTLAYADEEIEERPFREVNWDADRIVLWGGDSGEERLVVEFPFSRWISKDARVVATRFVLGHAR